jgi:serine/threonine protein phosphatase PrpC
VTLVARHAALTDIGLHRSANEDSYVVQPPLFAVCDGMGGAQAGEVASSLAVETLARDVAAGMPLREAAEAANAAVFALAGADADKTGMGTTLTAMLLQGDEGRFVHVGDSRAYLLRDAEMRQLSDDHSLVGEMLREGRLTSEEAAVHPHRSILSRALGTESTVRVDEFAVDLLAGDVVLLCSDGLCGVVGARTGPGSAPAPTRRRPPASSSSWRASRAARTISRPWSCASTRSRRQMPAMSLGRRRSSWRIWRPKRPPWPTRWRPRPARAPPKPPQARGRPTPRHGSAHAAHDAA